MKRRPFLKSTVAASALLLSGLFPFTVQAAETIKVGILHSLSGTMAISETSLKDMALMTIDEINAKGGVHAARAFTLLMIIQITTAGTMNNSGLILNFDLMACDNAAVSSMEPP
jgi:ABC-type branched-subunit amino acid transport system substrate-binding protein